MTRAPAVQLDLFAETAPAVPPRPAPREAAYTTSPDAFDFLAHPDPRTTPRPDWVIPDELRLPTDPEKSAK